MSEELNSAMSEEGMPTYGKPAMMLQCPNCHNIVFVGSTNIIPQLLELKPESFVYEVVRMYLKAPSDIVLPMNWRNCYVPAYPDTFPCTCGTVLKPVGMNESIHELIENG